MSQLSMSLRAWGDGCFSVGRSCGTMFQLAGVGDGELTNEPMSMGPFFLTECKKRVNNCTRTYTCFTFNIAYTLHTLHILNDVICK